MLERLRVQDLAIVEDVSVVFGEGLNILTGETGAGKSILIGAIDLLRGGRADRSLIRAGSSSCVIDALFVLPDAARINACLEEVGLPLCEDGQLLVKRSFSTSGAGRVLINESPTTVQTLRRVGALLVDLHGPHDNQSLFDPAFQLEVLDAFGQHGRELEVYDRLFSEQRRLLNLKAGLEEESASAQHETELLTDRVEEIRAAGLSEADGEELVQAHADAANAEELILLGQQAVQGLTEGEVSALDLLAAVQRDIAEMERLLDREATAWLEEARSVAVQVQEISRSINDRISAIDTSPARMAALEERLALVHKLKRKYGRDIEGILEICRQAEERLLELDTQVEQIAEAEAALIELEPRLSAAAEALSRRRLESSRRLEEAILRELTDLGFKDSLLQVGLRKTPYGSSGADAVDYQFAPNPGEPMRALREIASSGEMSRVMLAIKSVLAEHDHIPVLVFDEIDSNIGGEIGNAVGAKMRQIGERNHQVLCITHLPQVAVYGSRHVVVAKRLHEGRTIVSLETVSGDSRVSEVGRMLGGTGITSVVLAHAREMLKKRSVSKQRG